MALENPTDFLSAYSSNAVPSSPSALSTAPVLPDFTSAKHKKKQLEQRISMDSSSSSDVFREDDFRDRCCFDVLSILTVLQLVALLNFLLDALCTYLSLEHIATYAFAISSATSLLCLCTVISGVQEEKNWMIRGTMAYVVLKMIILVALSLVAFVGVFEMYLTEPNFGLSFELTLLLIVLPLFVALLCVQWSYSERVIRLIALRDELYIIPSAVGSVRMRESLRLALDAQKKARNSTSSKY
jgi:hypothetical protein